MLRCVVFFSFVVLFFLIDVNRIKASGLLIGIEINFNIHSLYPFIRFWHPISLQNLPHPISYCESCFAIALTRAKAEYTYVGRDFRNTSC